MQEVDGVVVMTGIPVVFVKDRLVVVEAGAVACTLPSVVVVYRWVWVGVVGRVQVRRVMVGGDERLVVVEVGTGRLVMAVGTGRLVVTVGTGRLVVDVVGTGGLVDAVGTGRLVVVEVGDESLTVVGVDAGWLVVVVVAVGAG